MSQLISFFSRKQSQTGFTMIEVLISVVVLSIGLLGLAGLQASSLKNNNSAYMRSQATILANDMLDRIRANAEGVRLGLYNNLYQGQTLSNPGCITTGCTPTTLATYDAWDWNSDVSTLLPSGRGTVIGSGSNSMFTITVMWDDARTGATGTACSGNSAVDLNCFVLSTQI